MWWKKVVLHFTFLSVVNFNVVYLVITAGICRIYATVSDSNYGTGLIRCLIKRAYTV